MIDGYDPVNDAVTNVTINQAVQVVLGLNVLPKNMINRQDLPLGCLRSIKFASMNILRSLLCKKSQYKLHTRVTSTSDLEILRALDEKGI